MGCDGGCGCFGCIGWFDYGVKVVVIGKCLFWGCCVVLLL